MGISVGSSVAFLRGKNAGFISYFNTPSFNRNSLKNNFKYQKGIDGILSKLTRFAAPKSANLATSSLLARIISN